MSYSGSAKHRMIPLSSGCITYDVPNRRNSEESGFFYNSAKTEVRKISIIALLAKTQRLGQPSGYTSMGG